MAMHHVFVINSDNWTAIIENPKDFAEAICYAMQTCGGIGSRDKLYSFRTTYASNSQNGMEAAVKRAAAYYDRGDK